MKITCEASVLAKAMRQVAPVAAKGAAVPILANVLIECDGAAVSLTTSNGDQWMTRTFDAVVGEAGGTTIDAARFSSVLSALDPGAQCELALDDNTIVLKAGRSRFRFGTLPTDQFPRPLVADGEPVTFGDDLFDALRASRHAVGVNVNLPATLGVFVRHEDGSTFVHASDGTRATRWQIPGAPAMEALLPTSCVDHLLKMADDNDAAVDIVTSDRLASFDFGATKMVSKLIDATWPLAQISRITPTAFQREAVVPREPFARSLHRLALIDDNKDRAVTIDFAPDMMTIQSIATRDSGVEQVPCQYTGDAFRIGLRTGHTIQAMDAIGADEITIGMNAWNEPVMLLNATNANVSVMVMPYLIIPKEDQA